MNNEKQVAIKVIHSIFQAPAIMIPKAKKPKPCVLPPNCLMLNINMAPANPANIEDRMTPIH
ncbi:hypothetical protein FACS1894166_07670 [Bacilli bacterium]|nr:hypothetical protein FACS1894166_07670 [Bacilli bacterium]